MLFCKDKNAKMLPLNPQDWGKYLIGIMTKLKQNTQIPFPAKYLSLHPKVWMDHWSEASKMPHILKMSQVFEDSEAQNNADRHSVELTKLAKHQILHQ